jgi:hypothetical protein
LPEGRALRLACNRDEQRWRPAALRPGLHARGQHKGAWPTDPVGGGTWVGVNDAGLALALLNVTGMPAEQSRGIARSRGAIIPELLGRGSLESAFLKAAALEPAVYAPFRLVLSIPGQWAEVASDGLRLSLVAPQPLRDPLLFTSSGLGDLVVARPRSELFAECFLEATPEAQDNFHRHQWPDRQHLSVCMRRPDARTVSFTTITITASRARLGYHAEAPDLPGETFSLWLNREGAAP